MSLYASVQQRFFFTCSITMQKPGCGLILILTIENNETNSCLNLFPGKKPEYNYLYNHYNRNAL